MALRVAKFRAANQPGALTWRIQYAAEPPWLRLIALGLALTPNERYTALVCGNGLRPGPAWP